MNKFFVLMIFISGCNGGSGSGSVIPPKPEPTPEPTPQPIITLMCRGLDKL